MDGGRGGAAVVRREAGDPKDGRPAPGQEVFRQFLPRIKQACDGVINITTGGSVIMTVEDRIAAATTFSPEMCSLNIDSMNFALHPIAARYKPSKSDSS